MGIRQALFNKLVNKDDGIKKSYLDSRQANPNKRFLSYGLLLKLNIRKYVLHKNIDTGLDPDKDKKNSYVAESLSHDIDTEKMLAAIIGYDVLSLDVFDTLILRKTASPEDVFYWLEDKLSYPGLREIRIKAESEARYNRFAAHGDTEVTIEEIWFLVEKWTGIPAVCGMDAEWDSELELCFANPFFVRLLEKIGNDIETVICTDTYWSDRHIKELLNNCGYKGNFSVYSSCDYRRSKADKRLYKVISGKLKGKRVIHIGDNYSSDVLNAKRSGIKTYYYPNVQKSLSEKRAQDMSPLVSSMYSGIINTYLYNGTAKVGREFELGFVYGGLLVTGFCNYIRDYSQSHGIEKILFLSRDGDILKKAYDSLFPEDKEKTEYVLWSRLAGLKACAKWCKPMYIDRMIRHKTNSGYRIGAIMETMEVADMLPLLLEEKHLKGDEFLDNGSAAILIDFIYSHWDTVLAHYEEQTDNATEYLIKTVDKKKSVAVIDVGWAGSGPMMIKKLLKESGSECDIYGIMAGSSGLMLSGKDLPVVELGKGDINCYIFSPMFNRDIWKHHDVGKGHNLVIEIILSANKPSLRSFDQSEDGSFIFSEGSETDIADEIQNGIMTFVDIYKKHPFRRYGISGADAYAPINLIINDAKFIKELVSSSKIRGNLE